MKSKNIPAETKSKSIKETREEINDILNKLENKYQDKVEIIRTIDLEYIEYTKAVENCHILLDQVYAYDQGYNALEAMAIGDRKSVV